MPRIARHMEESTELMQWSRYSHLFLSKSHGWLLFNSASGSFLELDDRAAEAVKQIQENPEAYDFESSPQLYLMLRSGGYLVKDGQDDDFYYLLTMKRREQNYVTRTLLLTIAVTRSCNFRCSYCYESDRSGAPMSEEVEEKLLDFIEMHKRQDQLYITWYGGEPLLAIDRIRSIDRKLKERSRAYRASVITNGYLLGPDIIRDLNDLNIEHMQITLDGNRDTHDSRRIRLDGGGTFDVILGNLDHLMASDYRGTVSIRVNVDMRNRSEFRDVYCMIRDRFPAEFGKQILVYPGYVKGEGHPDASCFFDSCEMGRFVADLAKEDGIDAMPLLPQRIPAGCTLTKRCAYVVGPQGELYKCWDDIGIPELVVGHIDDRTDWNMALIARGMEGCSYLNSPQCRECYFFPVCDGGCHKVRLRNLEDGGNRDSCSYFRDHLEELLELYYEQKSASAGTSDRGQ